MNYIRRRRLCDDYQCAGKLTTVEVVHRGMPIGEGLVFVPKKELERMYRLLGQVLCLGAVDDDEPVSPSE